jgi:hypothetical protein
VPYTLVSAATLGFDLVRLPAGRAVAEVLLTGLGADARGLGVLAAAHPGRGLDREERGALAIRSRRAREQATTVPHLRRIGPDDATGDTEGARAAALVTQLERGTIGDGPTLDRLLRDDILGPEHLARGFLLDDELAEATDVLSDAALGYWAAGVLPPLVRRELTGPFDAVRERGTVALPEIGADLGPAAEPLAELLEGIRSLDEAGRARWRAAVDEGRADHRPWASAMHEASWAAHVSGRLRALAAAQLHAVQAFLDGGFDLHDGAAGAWNAVAGCVQGIAMGDLVDDASLAVLRAPWLRATRAH